MSDPPVDPDRALIDVVASAGSAVDRAQVACDLLAHRIVGVVATTDPGRSPDAWAELRDGAGACAQLAQDAAVLTRRFHTARARRLDDHDAFVAPVPDPVRTEFDALERAGASLEGSVAVVARAVDAAERRLRARGVPGATLPAPGPGTALGRPTPSASDDVLLN
jgi:hypothetical protein